MKLDVTLERKSPDEHLIDPYMYDRGPKYVIMGGLIFQELTQAYLKSWGDKWDTRGAIQTRPCEGSSRDLRRRRAEKAGVPESGAPDTQHPRL